MPELRLELEEPQDDASYSSTARVSLDTMRSLKAPWGCFAVLRCGASSPRVVRLEVDESQNAQTVRVDHWTPSEQTEAPLMGDMVDIECLAAGAVRSVQYIEVSPARDDQPRLALAFVKSLLREQILPAMTGVITLQLDGLNYGSWRYRAFCRGTIDSADVPDGVNAGVISDNTMVLMFPFASGRSSTQPLPELQPIGAHGQRFRELVAMALRSRRGFFDGQQFASYAPRSLMLQGASGSGKSTLVQQVAEDLNANLVVLDCGLLSTPQLRIEDFFAAVLRIQPSILLIEDLELLFPRVLDENKYKMVCTVVRCLEAINNASAARVVVVGTVSVVEALHTKVRQVFADEVLLDVRTNSVPERHWMFNLLKSVLPKHLAMRDEFVMSLVTRYGQRPSTVIAIAGAIETHFNDLETPLDQLTEAVEADVAAVARDVASASASSTLVGTSVPDVSWDDIGGLDQVKQRILEMAVWPLEKPHIFRRMGITPPLGIILHGPPGTGKTMLAKAAAAASKCNFLNLSASDLMRAEFGESEKAISRAFATARSLSPCLVFIDEFQSLFGDRTTAGATTSRMISQLLVEFDALKAIADDAEAHRAKDSGSDSPPIASMARIFVMAATNSLSAVDPAFLQPGRFENVVYVGLPNAAERREILKVQRAKMPWHSDVQLDVLVEATERANAASLVALCQAAAIQAMQRVPRDGNVSSQEQAIQMEDFLSAISKGNFDFGPSTQPQAS